MRTFWKSFNLVLTISGRIFLNIFIFEYFEKGEKSRCLHLSLATSELGVVKVNWEKMPKREL